MDTFRALQEKYIFYLFRLSIFLKGTLSALEIFAGTFILIVSPAAIGSAIIATLQNELDEEPAGFFITHAVTLAQQFALTPRAFLAFYLLSRGVIKLILVIALLKNKLWAYPAALLVLGLFMVYQFYQIFVDHSLFMIALTLFDFIVMWLIWHEYQLVRKHVTPGTVE